MINYIVTTVITSFSAIEIVLLFYNHKVDYKYKFWILISCISEVILCISWVLTALFLNEPETRFESIVVDYILAISYLIIAIFHFLFLSFDDDENDEYVEKNRKYFLDEKSGMLRKYNEEKFNDGRPLYSASSLIRVKEDNDRNK